MGNSNGKPVVLTDEVSLDHFRLLRVVGKGAFGKVRIVERKDTGLTFALKYIRKDEVVRTESVRNIIRERRMLQHLNHPFLCNLRYSFQDVEYLYLVVDLMTGGDLRFHISRKAFTEDAVRFWIAELACALRYIHKQGVVHRDVKPDNILLDSEGHVHLADFNVASDFRPDRPLTSKSGTLAYLAPEVYQAGKAGYRSEVDWWSLGVTFYECIYNKRPFEGSTHEALAAVIVKADPKYPSTSPPISRVCLHAISSLLEKNKTRRIGAAGFETFTDNPFFRDIDFDALERKEIEPVFCPSSEKTNFDATYDLEELLLEEAPLEARARKRKPRAELRDDATKQEIRADELHRMIEAHFEPFNYTLLPESRSPVEPSSPTVPTSSAAAAAAIEELEPPIALAHPEQPRSDVTGSASRTRVSTNSADGSPPLSAAVLSGAVNPPLSTDYFPLVANRASGGPTSAPFQQQQPQPPPPQQQRSPKPDALQAPTSAPMSPPTSDPMASPPRAQRPPNPVRSASSGSGEPGSTKVSGSPTDELPKRSDRPTGMLAFLGRKKGRDRSPKARERGVLGKEGARVVLKD